MKIKVCGLREPDNIKAVAALQPDYMGFICYTSSLRYIGELPAEALAGIPASIHKTGVFVNETAKNINLLIDKYGFDAIQLHGNESPAFCKAFKGKVTVIDAFGLDSNFDFNQINNYIDYVDYFLFDTKTPVYGGSGKTFNWDILNNYTFDVPFFLSGGISLDNLDEVKTIGHPQFYAVDLNSRFEKEPGVKSMEKLEKAFDIIKKQHNDEVRG